METWMWIVIATWLPIGYLGARLFILLADNFLVDTDTGRPKKSINNDGDRVVFVLCSLLGYLAFAFMLLTAFMVIGAVLVGVIIEISYLLRIHKLLHWMSHNFMWIVRRLSPN